MSCAGVPRGVFNREVKEGWFWLCERGERGVVGSSRSFMARLEDELRERGVSGVSKMCERDVPGVSGSGGVGLGSRPCDVDGRLNVRELSLLRMLGREVDWGVGGDAGMVCSDEKFHPEDFVRVRDLGVGCGL